MRILMTTIGTLLLAACSPAATTQTIDGTYKIDMATAKLSDKPDTIVLKDGQYDCSTCTPPYKIAADGKPQPVAGRDYWDSASVKVVNPTTLEITRYRKGAAVSTTKVEVSADGQMLTWTTTSADNAEGKAVTNSSKSKRTGPAPEGAHAASGSWVAVNEGAQIADESLMATILVKDGTVTQKFPTGESYEAKLGGPQVPLVGDKAGATIAVVAEGTGFKETGYVNGKAVSEYTYRPVDANTIKMTAHDLRSGETSSYTLTKQ
jgi:hypothetical protein